MTRPTEDTGSIETPRPEKVLFAHVPKAAGTHVIRYFRDKLGYRHHRSAKRTKTGVWLDYTCDEVRQLVDEAGFLNTHVLAAGWHELVELVPPASADQIVQTIREFRARGWFVFSFVRHPGEHLCSFYHYVLDADRIGLKEAVKLHTPVLGLTIEEFVSRHCDRDLLPAYWRELDFVGVASDESLARFFAQYFEHSFEPNAVDPHASGNPGYAFYCDSGQISAATQARIEASTNMRVYREILSSQTG